MKHAALNLAASTAILLTMGAAAQAADLGEPMVIEPPVYHAPEAVPSTVGGWYIRGDIGYRFNTFRGADYMTATGYDGFLDGDLKGSYSIGGGVGYHINHYLRTDLTLDYDFKTDFTGSTTGTCTELGTGATVACTSTDTSGYKAWTLLANAYVDLGTYGRVTPYVGAGIGGAHVTWHNLTNSIGAGYDQTGDYVHEGASNWRFAYALMAGASVDITCNVAADVGYRYKHINGNQMFGYEAVSDTGIGNDRGIKSHEVRAGLRYKLGGCKTPAPEPVVYHPQPVFK